jgi:hypothetical protein
VRGHLGGSRKDSRRTDSCRPPRWSSSPRGWSDRASVAVGERAGRRLREPTRCSRDLRVPARQRSQPPLARSLASARETGQPFRSPASAERRGGHPGHPLRRRDRKAAQVAHLGETDGTRVQVASFGWRRRNLPSGRQLRLEETERHTGKRAGKAQGLRSLERPGCGGKRGQHSFGWAAHQATSVARQARRPRSHGRVSSEGAGTNTERWRPGSESPSRNRIGWVGTQRREG